MDKPSLDWISMTDITANRTAISARKFWGRSPKISPTLSVADIHGR